ncbi:MAG: T9SS type A sorting domain-containing protein [Bacteroidia bacterium]|nr:T9SS type A sorting domain-containing protein [Bacteroidia bacterium]MCZ2276686.1 T9SS type A sorting domain-containing protein [Bacteroidia bacterium]
MKHIFTLSALLFLSSAVFGQITITSADMPSAGDSGRFTKAVVNPLINYSATGPNHSWNFSNLRNSNQDLKEYFSIASTGLVYSLFYANLPFNPNRANVAEAGQELPANPLLTITDPLNFYYSSSAAFKQVGLGFRIANIPTPVTFSQHDVIYQFPVNYNNRDTSYSAWNIGLPGLGYYGFTQTRINYVDGWGTLITPHATYNVLRVKTELYAKDTISVDTLNLHFSLNRPKTTHYKWLTNNEIVPVLQITTTEVLGLEIVTEIIYRDDYNTVQPGSLDPVYCAGSQLTLPYTATGSYNGAAFLQPANVFTAQLSDSSGDFSNPVIIGSITSRVSGNINVTIPASTPPGNAYRIRIVSSSPALTGSDNGSDIRIESLAQAVILANGNTSFCNGDSVVLQAGIVNPFYSYQWQLNGNNLTGATDSVLNVQVAGNYSLNVSNSCGVVTSNMVQVTVHSLPVVTVTASGPLSFCQGDSVILSANVDSAYMYQWQVNGLNLTGEINPEILVYTEGDYTLMVSNTCGTTSSAVIPIIVHPLPAVPQISLSGDSLLATGSGTFQWYFNGIPLPGAIGNYYIPQQNGNYTVGVTNQNGCQAISNGFPMNTVNVLTLDVSAQISVFPNPVQDIAIIEAPAHSAIEVMNLSGQVIQHYTSLQQSVLRVDFSYLAKGMYLLKFSNFQSTDYIRLIKL